jgi:hypothetical protein
LVFLLSMNKVNININMKKIVVLHFLFLTLKAYCVKPIPVLIDRDNKHIFQSLFLYIFSIFLQFETSADFIKAGLEKNTPILTRSV